MESCYKADETSIEWSRKRKFTNASFDMVFDFVPPLFKVVNYFLLQPWSERTITTFFMELSLERLPPDYFVVGKKRLSTLKEFGEKRYLRKMRRKKSQMWSKTSKEDICILSTIVTLIVTVLAFLVLTIFWNPETTSTIVNCPIGYFGERCERNDFLDLIPWTGTNDVSAEDGTCQSGYSFRTWAPGARIVNLVIKLSETSQPTYYPMM